MTTIPTETPIVTAQGVAKQVAVAGGTLDILTDITFSVAAGDSVAVVGVSGSGKSTLIGLLAGLDLPSAGRITLAGEELNGLDEDGRARLRGRQVGFVFQSFLLLPGMTALENVMLPLELAGAADAEQQARRLLQRVGLEERLDHYPKQLSGGEQQRVAIARALIMSPQLLLADEPTGNLDSRTSDDIYRLLQQLHRERGLTMVIVTHNEGLAQRLDRVVHMEDGRLVD